MYKQKSSSAPADDIFVAKMHVLKH